jgi:PAS domain S-box-containing protein
LNKKGHFFQYEKIVLIGFILFIIVISIISSTLNLLKLDAEETHKNIADVYNKTFSEHLNNTIYNIELFVDGIKILYVEKNDEKTIDEYLLRYLRENPYIRSINILKNNSIIQSTNKSNFGLYINTDDYYPTPLFKKDILRFGNSYYGRDFDDGIELNSLNKYSFKDSFFLPISKTIELDNNKKIVLLIALNNEQFLNKYIQTLDNKIAFMEILNLNGDVLISNDASIKPGNKILNDNILNILKEKNSYAGIENFNGLKKDIISIKLLKNYPLVISLRFDYDKTLENWEERRFIFLIIITILLIFIVVLILIFIIKNNNEKQKEIELHKEQIENEKRFKILFEESHFLSFILDENGKINKINNTALLFIGDNKSKFLDQYIWDLYCFNDNDKYWLENVITSYSEGNKIEKELLITNYNNDLKEIEIVINSILIDNKKELVFFGKDITEKKHQEKKLRQAYQVFKNTHDGIMITDEEVNIINVNDAFIKSTGYKLAEIINKNPKILKSNKYEKDFYVEMWKEIKEKDYWDGELLNKRKDGTYYSEWLTISAVYNEKNVLTNYIGIFSDITKQKEQEKMLKEKERILFQQSKMASMGEMLGNIAHQWRQPLSVISIASGAIKLSREYEELYSSEEVSEFIESIGNSTKYLSETIDDFRNFFTQDTNYKKFDTYSAITATLKLLSSNFKYKEIEIIFKRTEDVDIFGNRNEFKQVIMNILNNSKDALLEKNIEKKKLLFIDIYSKNKHIIIDLFDNAGGIDANIIDKVFEPYFTTKHQSIGTGIGLFMSEEIISKHMNGEILVSNEYFAYENINYIGAKFTLKLPINLDE